MADLIVKPTLPPALASDPRFSALCDLLWEQHAKLPLDKLLLYLVDTAPEVALLPLAEQFSMTEEVIWPAVSTPDAKRNLIKQAIALHRSKGTPWAVKQALAAHGYGDCEIIEHSQHMARWLAAGGEVLDGGNTLDGATDLSAPSGDFRFVTHHWAEYALRLNAVDGPTTRAMMREIIRLCAAYAPARARLVTILLFAAARFDATVHLLNFAARGRTIFTGCRRLTIPDFDTLDGCDIIGGETLLSTLDGSSLLDGASTLVPERYTGEPLDAGQLSITVPAARIKLALTTLGGTYVEPPETLDDADFLDGSSAICGETLDGTGTLDGDGDLRYPTLGDGEDFLDGTSNLGEIPAPATIAFWGRVRIRRGSLIYQEPL